MKITFTENETTYTRTQVSAIRKAFDTFTKGMSENEVARMNFSADDGSFDVLCSEYRKDEVNYNGTHCFDWHERHTLSTFQPLRIYRAELGYGYVAIHFMAYGYKEVESLMAVYSFTQGFDEFEFLECSGYHHHEHYTRDESSSRV